MSFASLLIHSVDITTPTATPSSTDKYGNVTYTTSTASGVPARVQETGSSESLVDRDTRVTDYLVFLPAGTAITSLSTVVWQSRAFRVRGDPTIVDGGAAPHHVEATLQEVTG